MEQLKSFTTGSAGGLQTEPLEAARKQKSGLLGEAERPPACLSEAWLQLSLEAPYNL
jgi:hypothetical protein